MNRALPAVIAVLAMLPALIPGVLLMTSGREGGTVFGFLLISGAMLIGSAAHLSAVQRLSRPEPIPVRVVNK